MLEGCFVTCYLQEDFFQLSREVNCSKALDSCKRKVQASFNGHSRKLRKLREVSLGSC